MNKKFIGAISTALVFVFALSSCSTQEKNNSSNIEAYLATLYTDEEALISNNYSGFDDKNSFEVAFDTKNQTFGDSSDAEKINWGLASSFLEPACEYENFWGASTKALSSSPKVVGMATKLNSILMTIDNFNKSNFGIVIQNVLSFKSEVVAKDYYKNINSAFGECSKNVKFVDLNGEITTAPFTNIDSARIRFLKPNDQTIARVSEDGLVHLQLFALTKYSVVNFEIMINDLTSANQSNWAPLNRLINASLSRVCALEECSHIPISLETSNSFVPIEGDILPIKL